MVDDLNELISEVKTLEEEIKALKKEMPDIEKYQVFYKLKISEAIQKIREIKQHIKSLDLKDRRCDK